ncbi:MAG: arsenic resistance N-acetyltransferase ArsN2 [Steroidobacteraceae bacterium]
MALLTAAALPALDLTEGHMEHFFFIGPEAAPIGLIGVEFCGSEALLRSLVVARDRRSEGIGGALVDHVESHAHARGARSIFLLTTTAEAFFSRRGYVRAARQSAPSTIRNTREFAHICPAGSAFLVKQI